MRRLLALVSILILSTSLFATSEPKVALVLSGGGARGIAHIALLEAIEEEGIPIDLIVGTSIGSMIGAMYSVGYTPDEIREVFFNLDIIGLFGEPVTEKSSFIDRAFVGSRNPVFDIGFSGSTIGKTPAIIGDQRILELLGFLFAKVPAPLDFDQLPIPFRAISADIINGDEIIHDSGSLMRAVRSSISIPLIFAPFPLEDGRLVIDGGAVDNLPINVARALGADYVIASDLNAYANEDLHKAETLSGVVMQSLILVTQGSAFAQHPAADVVITPDLHDVTILDGFKLELIDQRGKAAVEESRSELIALKEEIAAHRELVVYDLDRIGRYTSLPDPIIRSVSIEDISLTPKALLFDESLFEFMVGSELSKERANSFALRLRQVRRKNALASLSYEMQEKGNLSIIARSFRQTGNFITMGFVADSGVSNTLTGSYVWFRANAYLDAGLVNIGKNNLTYTLGAALGEQTSLDVGLEVPLGNHYLGARLGFGVGSLTPHSSVVNAERTPPLDRRLLTEFTYRYQLAAHTYFEVATRGEFTFINDAEYARSFVAYPYAELSFVYSTLDKILDPEGIRIESAALVGSDDRLALGYHVRLHHNLRLSFLDTLGYIVEIARLDGPAELIDSFVEVTVPGYGPHTLKRDLIHLGVHYQRYLFDIASYPSYLKLDVNAAWFNRVNPLVEPLSDRSQFMDLDLFDLGFGAGFGVQTPVGNLILSVGVSITGSWSVSLGIS